MYSSLKFVPLITILHFFFLRQHDFLRDKKIHSGE